MALRPRALIDALLLAHEQGLDPMSLPLEEADRSLLAAVLMDEHEELTPELLESCDSLAAPARPAPTVGRPAASAERSGATSGSGLGCTGCCRSG